MNPAFVTAIFKNIGVIEFLFKLQKRFCEQINNNQSLEKTESSKAFMYCAITLPLKLCFTCNYAITDIVSKIHCLCKFSLSTFNVAQNFVLK